MTPDPDTRIGQLEREVAGLAIRVESVDSTVRTFAPIAIAMARVEEHIAALKQDVNDCTRSIAAVKHDSEDYRKKREQADFERALAAKQERNSVRVALIGLTAVIVAAMITTIGTMIVAGVIG